MINSPALIAYIWGKYDWPVRALLNKEVLIKRVSKIKSIADSNNSNKKFYIIARAGGPAGLFSYVLTATAQILYAISKGMIPVVDMQNYENLYLEIDIFGKENAWEYYFKQPCGYRLKDMDKCNYIYSDLYIWQKILPFDMNTNRNQYNKYHHLWYILYSNFLSLSEDAKKFVEHEYNRLIKPGMRILGVYYRGKDYIENRSKNQLIQPSVFEMIEKVSTVYRNGSGTSITFVRIL